ncbi:phosphatase PAP2 family protein [Mycobacterium intermedium]|uniref:Phosphatase PAP2 family protein n=1 Tax=Mycobacterium intermedium TaxID=28445 RepID=A0A1T3W1I8_MYCIE|nr:phosphatase PAP2 family protein [Mycobacterium intermedium]ORB06930.1 phosphatase PAP2 family protein [Mycobacterium intermedium]
MATALAVAAGVLYVVLWVGHRQDWGWLHTFDWWLLNPAYGIGIKHVAWVRFWDAVSFVLGPVPIRILGAVAAAVALVKRQVRIGLLLLCCATLNGLVTLAAKGLADRPRPATALVHASSTSFPSGHALEAMAAVLAVLTVLLPVVRRRAMRVAAVVLAALSVITVGVARVALNVHHPSDVIAGWALGYLYFLLCLWLIRPLPLRRAEPGRLVTTR